MFDFELPVDRAGTNSMKWDAAGAGQLPMGLADMDFRTAPVILEALERQVEHGVFGYTAAGSEFFDAVTGWVARRRGLVIEPDWVVPCPGVMGSIAHLLLASLQSGDGVIVQTPAFSPIPEVVEANGLRVIDNPLRMIDGRYEMDLDAVRSVAERDDVKAFVLCSPHNPSGRVWSRHELEVIAEIASENRILVVSDEIHAEVVYPWAEFLSYASVAAGSTPFATCFGPSKAFNLPSLRTSVTVVADANLRSALENEMFKVNEGFGVSGPGSVALTAAYSAGEPWLAALTDHLENNLALLTAGLEENSPIRVVRPDASYLVWLDCRGLQVAAGSVPALIADAGVIVEPGESFGPEGSGFVRLNIGTTQSRVVEAVERIVSDLGT